MVLVPATGSDRRETATLLLALAREKGIPTGAIRSVYNGYEVPEELLSCEDKAVVAPEPTPKTIVMDEAPKRRGRPAAKESPVDSPQED